MVQVDHTAEVHTEYLLLNCHFVAQSDEQKKGLIPLAFNLENGAPAGRLEAMLDGVENRCDHPVGSPTGPPPEGQPVSGLPIMIDGLVRTRIQAKLPVYG